jgi:[ribosomal protein S5]-alanine N-acetyltransferase
MIGETERLRLRELTTDDAAFILRLVNDPAWIEFIGDRGIRSLDGARDYLESGPLRMYREHGFGLWLVERKTDGAALGICGLLKRETLADVDLGFAFQPEARGHGYAHEAAQASLDYAVRRVGLRRVVALTAPVNPRSIRLLEKLGFQFESMVQLTAHGGESRLFGWQAPGPGAP